MTTKTPAIRHLSRLKKLRGPLIWNQGKTKGAEWAALFSRHMDEEKWLKAMQNLDVLVALLTKFQLSFELTSYDLSQEIMAKPTSAAALEESYSLLRSYFTSLQSLSPDEQLLFHTSVGTAYGVERSGRLVPSFDDLKTSPNFEKYETVRSTVGYNQGRPGMYGWVADLLIGYWQKITGLPADYRQGPGHILQFVSEAADLHFRSESGRQAVPLVRSCEHQSGGQLIVESLSIRTVRDGLVKAIKERIKENRARKSK